MIPNPERAAQYLRTSTGHQAASLEAQALSNAGYAEAAGYTIVRSFVDAGCSGVRLAGRPGLAALLHAVWNRTADFSVILVHDVSRWGRFRDPDEGAHYEFVCREFGVRVEYSGEGFDNGQAYLDLWMKQLKRLMAGEYSRELSVRVSRARARLAAAGFWLGGDAGLGFRRAAVTVGGQVLAPLEAGQRIARRGVRSVLVAGPAAEIALARRMMRAAAAGQSASAIARQLNAAAVEAAGGRAWTRARVLGVVTADKYAAIGPRRREPGLVTAAFDAAATAAAGGPATAAPQLVTEAELAAARRGVRRNHRRVSDAELLAELALVLQREGRLTHDIIARAPECHAPEVYKRRFGGLLRTYERVGYVATAAQRCAAATAARHQPHRARRPSQPMPDAEMLERLRQLLARYGHVSTELIRCAPGLPTADAYRERFGSMRRVYDLIGHAPNAAQAAAMDRAEAGPRDPAARLRTRAARRPPDGEDG